VKSENFDENVSILLFRSLILWKKSLKKQYLQ